MTSAKITELYQQMLMAFRVNLKQEWAWHVDPQGRRWVATTFAHYKDLDGCSLLYGDHLGVFTQGGRLKYSVLVVKEFGLSTIRECK